MDPKVLEVLVWPAVVLILGFTGLAMFKTQVRHFLGRTQSVGKGWLVATPPEQQLSGIVQTPEALEFLDSYSDELLKLQEKAIYADMADRKLDQKPDSE